MAYVDIKIPGGVTPKKIEKIQKALDLLLRIGEENMSMLSDFIATQSAWNQRMDAAVDAIAAKMAAGGGMTAEEQQGLLNLQSHSETHAMRLEELAAPPTVM